MRKRIGVITHYWGNENCGGLLQAHALVYILNSMGYEAEQIAYVQNKKESHSLWHKTKQVVKKIIIASKAGRIQGREFRLFMKSIPHSKIYTHDTISKSNNDYNVFVSGSDQIWNPLLCCDGYFLEFVDKDKIKLSYAASIGLGCLTQEQLTDLKNKLQSFDAISLREKDLVQILSTALSKSVYQVLDPTLLLDKDMWSTVEDKELKPKFDKYILTYFLSGNPAYRQLSEKISTFYGIKIINLPYTFEDSLKNGNNVYNWGPRQFITYINKAEFVITDSFHATAFSIIYHKKFANLQRENIGEQKTSSRINSLYEILGMKSRWVDDVNKIEVLEQDISWATVDNRLKILRESSLQFLRNAISTDL